jgi:hypothetical protein
MGDRLALTGHLTPNAPVSRLCRMSDRLCEQIFAGSHDATADREAGGAVTPLVRYK